MERCIEMKGRGGDLFLCPVPKKKSVCVWGEKKKKEEKKKRKKWAKISHRKWNSH